MNSLKTQNTAPQSENELLKADVESRSNELLQDNFNQMGMYDEDLHDKPNEKSSPSTTPTSPGSPKSTSNNNSETQSVEDEDLCKIETESEISPCASL